MNSKSMRFYKLNLAFGIIHTASTVFLGGELVMLMSLVISSIQTLILTYKFGGVVYYLWSILIIALFIFTAAGMLLVPPGAVLSLHSHLLPLSLSTDLLVHNENFMSQQV